MRYELTNVLLTIGHSNRTLEAFLHLLVAHGVTGLVDVRTIPQSRYNPQFNRETLPDALAKAGIRYAHMAGLGGRRQPRPDSHNAGWRHPSFRGYADYMQTPQFEEHLATLLQMAQVDRIAVMCAEAVPWRCHRSLIADAAVVRGVPVDHIMSPTVRSKHTLTPFARVEGAGLTYPGLFEEPGAARRRGHL